jgi:uncharacterized membrane protein YfhO
MVEEVPTIDVSRVALTNAPLEGLQSPAAASVHVVVDDPGRIEIEVDTSARVLMTTTESYHSGWKALAAGRDLRTVAVYGDHLGVVLEPGRYRLALRFAPGSTRNGIALSALTLLLTAAAGAVLRRSVAPR